MAILDSIIYAIALLIPVLIFGIVIMAAWWCICLGRWPRRISLALTLLFAILLSCVFPGVPSAISASCLICLILGFLAGVYCSRSFGVHVADAESCSNSEINKSELAQSEPHSRRRAHGPHGPHGPHATEIKYKQKQRRCRHHMRF